MRFLAAIITAIAIIALAFHYAKPLPGTNFDESFLPKASSVRYMAAGHDASVADSLFYTPYYFVGGVTPVDAPDTSDFSVLRRASRVYPENWRLSLYFALRLARGPYPNRTEAANVMRKYFDSPDTTIPDHIRTIYRSFELDSMQTETALETILNDVMQPRFKKFRTSFYKKILRLLGYNGFVDPETDENYLKVKKLVDGMVEGRIHPAVVFRELLAMKKVEELNVEESKTENSVDSTATSTPDTTAVKTVADSVEKIRN